MKRILLVDDDSAVLGMMTDFCLAFGHVVEATNDPRRALQICFEEDVFDLIITDFNMPVWSGLTFALKYRNFECLGKFKRIPIICYTSDDVERVEQFNRRDGSPLDKIVLKGSLDLQGLNKLILDMTKGTSAHA